MATCCRTRLVTGWSFFPISSAPAPLDLVWCRFPLNEDPNNPGPKNRPALVRSLIFNKGHTRALLDVTYGTTKLRHSENPFDLIISNLASIDACGLPAATRFALGRTIIVPWCSEFFQAREGYNSPRIGSLDTQSKMQLEAIKVARRIHHP